MWTGVMNIEDHYKLLGEAEVFHTYTAAEKAADGNPDHIWFVRGGDEPICTCSDEECECEEVWDVELYHGQFVNNVGFFVSEEPCRPEHREAVFTF